MPNDYLKNKRENLGLSQKEFAEKSGINLRTLQDYEQGRKPLSSVKGEVLYRISTALDCDMEDLIVETVYPEEDSQGRIYKYFVQFQELFKACGDTVPSEEGKVIYTPFDDVFRTLSVDCSSLLIPVINEAFNEHYSYDDLIEHSQNEHLKSGEDGLLNKKISDSNFIILTHEGKRIRYQIECQSTQDNSILLRIFEYSSAIAAEQAVLTKEKLCISYPRAALIYLRSTENTPDNMTIELNTPGGDVLWNVPVIKTGKFTLDEIFKKRLYMFLPYYILVYENNLFDIESDEEKLNKLKDEYLELRLRLDDASKEGNISEYDKLTVINMCMRVFEYYSIKYGKISREVKAAMGGQVLEYEAKDIKREGIREGRNILIEELLAAGVIDQETAKKYAKM